MKSEIKFVSLNADNEWPHFTWSVKINGCAFEYRTGLGHKTNHYRYDRKRDNYPIRNQRPKDSIIVPEGECWAHIPKLDDVLKCLFLDARAGSESFDSFCDNLGYSNDSLKALDTYRACAETEKKLRKALGEEYQTEQKRIEALDL